MKRITCIFTKNVPTARKFENLNDLIEPGTIVNMINVTNFSGTEFFQTNDNFSTKHLHNN